MRELLGIGSSGGFRQICTCGRREHASVSVVYAADCIEMYVRGMYLRYSAGNSAVLLLRPEVLYDLDSLV